jgi:hypothetical protein
MKQTHIKLQMVEFIPETLADGILYVSQKYMTAIHRCCCGCGQEVVTPLGRTEWSLQVDDKLPTLYPSIGNWSFACHSHYWIRNGNVVWSYAMSKEQIDSGRARDQRMRDAHFAHANRKKDEVLVALKTHAADTSPVEQNANGIEGPWKRFWRWLGG